MLKIQFKLQMYIKAQFFYTPMYVYRLKLLLKAMFVGWSVSRLQRGTAGGTTTSSGDASTYFRASGRILKHDGPVTSSKISNLQLAASTLAEAPAPASASAPAPEQVFAFGFNLTMCFFFICSAAGGHR